MKGPTRGKASSYRGLDDFAFFRRLHIVVRRDEALAAFVYLREAEHFIALHDDTSGMEIVKVPYLYPRRSGPLFDDEPAPPAKWTEVPS